MNEPTEKPDAGLATSTLKSNFVAASIILTQGVQMISYGAGITSALSIGKSMGATPIEASWIAAAYPLTQGAFVLMGGRVGAVYGHKNLAVLGSAWWVIFTLVSAFVRNFIGHCTVRALAGIGGAFMVPNTIALLTIAIPPGKRRNVAVGLFGAMAPIGAAGGSVFPGFFVQLTDWKWLYVFLAVLGAIVFLIFALVVPAEPEPMDKEGSIDYVGAGLGVSGLILFNFAWNQAPVVGWKTGYVYGILIAALAVFALFSLWEWRFAKEPILPLSIFKAPTFAAMVGAAFLTFMAIGIVIWYINVINIEIRHYTIFSSAAGYTTLAICGAGAAILSAVLVRVLPAQAIMIIGSLCSAAALILVATSPAQQSYWAQFFPALIFTAFGPDFLFTASQIVASNSVSRQQQGIAGSLMGTLLSYGLSTGLGFAGTVDVYSNDHGRNPLAGHRHALWLGVGFAFCGALLALLFVRIPKDTREGWTGEGVTTTKDAGA